MWKEASGGVLDVDLIKHRDNIILYPFNIRKNIL
jgi:hypothetical protein